MYDKLVKQCKEEYSKNNIRNAWFIWEKLYDEFYEEFNKGKNTLEQYEIFSKFDNAINKFTKNEIRTITDYGNDNLFLNRYSIVNITYKKFEVVKNFCEMYKWEIVQYNNNYNIYNLITNKLVLKEDTNFTEVIRKVLEQAINYFVDEQNWENEEGVGYIYGKELFDLIIHFPNTDMQWVKDFESYLKNMQKIMLERQIECLQKIKEIGNAPQMILMELERLQKELDTIV